MAEKIPIRVQHKRMSSSEWLESSIILLDGEIGIETNTGKAKVGNGTSRYRDLKYIAGEKGEKGDVGEQGIRGEKGADGTFQALSQQEKESLKGKDAVVGDYNLLLNSLFPDTNVRTSGNPTLAIIPSDYNGRNALDVKKSGAGSNTWAGVQIDTSQRMLRAGDKLVLRLPIYIYSDVNLDSGLYLNIKKHTGNRVLKSINLSDIPRDKWTVYEEKITITETMDFMNELHWFYLYVVKNGHFKIAEPYISYGDEIPPKWQPNLDDLKGNNIANQQNGQTLKYWVGTETQYNALPFKDNDTIYDIVR